MHSQPKKSTMTVELLKTDSKDQKPEAQASAEQALEKESERQLADEVVQKSDSIAMTASGDSTNIGTNLRLDTVINIKSDLSMAEEKKEDESDAEVANPKAEASDRGLESPGTTDTAAETLDLDNLNGNPPRMPTEDGAEDDAQDEAQDEAQSAPSVEEITEAAEGMTSHIIAIFGEEEEEEEMEDAFGVRIPNFSGSSIKSEPSMKSEGSIKSEVSEPQPEPEKEAEQQPEEDAEPQPEEEAKPQLEVAKAQSEEVAKAQSEEVVRVQSEEQSKEASEASDDSEAPVASPQVTTRPSVSMDSDTPMMEPVITTNVSEMSCKSTKSVQFAEETDVSSKDDEIVDVTGQEDDTKKAGVGRLFGCGAPVCGDMEDVAAEETEQNSIVLEEQSGESSPAEAKCDNEDAPHEEANSQEPKKEVQEETAEAESSTMAPEEAEEHKTQPDKQEEEEEAPADRPNQQADAEPHVQEPQDKADNVDGEEAIGPTTDATPDAPMEAKEHGAQAPAPESSADKQEEKASATEEVRREEEVEGEEKKTSDPAPEAAPSSPVPGAQPSIDNNGSSNTKEKLLLDMKDAPFVPQSTIDALKAGPGPLEKPAGSFDYQPGITCSAVFSCGITAKKEDESTRHIPLSNSQDFILDAREQSEKEVESRSASNSISLNDDSNTEAIPSNAMDNEELQKKLQVVGENPSDGGAIQQNEEEKASIEDGKPGQAQPTEEGKPDQVSAAVSGDPSQAQPAEDGKPDEVSAVMSRDPSQAQPAEEKEMAQAHDDSAAKPQSADTAPCEGEAPVPVKSKSVDSRMAASMAGVIVDEKDLDAAAKAQAEAYACGCTIL